MISKHFLTVILVICSMHWFVHLVADLEIGVRVCFGREAITFLMSATVYVDACRYMDCQKAQGITEVPRLSFWS